MRIIFVGTVKFSNEILKTLIQNRFEIVGVCTKKISKIHGDFFSLGPLAKEAKIPVLYTKSLNDNETFMWIKELNPDVILCFGWSEIIKSKLLKLPKNGVFGYHPSKLPFNKGRHPIIWTLALGLEETASTFIKLDEGIDTGEIIDQKIVEVLLTDYANDLYEKLIETAKKQIIKIMYDLINGNLKLTPQPKGVYNVWRKRSFEDGKIDWRMGANEIYNLVRSLSPPYPVAHFIYENREIKVLKCKVFKHVDRNIEPGKVIKINHLNIVVKAGKDSVELTDITPNIKIKLGEYI